MKPNKTSPDSVAQPVGISDDLKKWKQKTEHGHAPFFYVDNAPLAHPYAGMSTVVYYSSGLECTTYFLHF